MKQIKLRLNGNKIGVNQHYQKKLEGLFVSAFKKHPRLFINRIDLRFPIEEECAVDSKVITRFFDSLKAKLKARENKIKRKGGRVYKHGLVYAWVREVGPESNKVHYHTVLIFNKDAFYTLGKFDISQDSLYSMIISAWNSALKLNKPINGLVHCCHVEDSYLDKNRADYQDKYDAWVSYLSYLAKDYSKPYGDGNRVFGCSR